MKKILVISLLISLFVATASTAVAEVGITTLSSFRFYTPVGDSDTTKDESADSTFQLDRLIIMFRGSIKDNIKCVYILYLHPWVTFNKGEPLYLGSCEFSGTLGSLKQRLLAGNGLNMNFGIPPSYVNRKTSEYTIVSDMFTHERIVGLQYKCTAEKFNFGISIHNGHKLGTRKAGGLKSKRLPFTADRGLDLASNFADNNQGKDITGRVGLTPVKDLDIGASGSFAIGGLYDDGKKWQKGAPVVDDLDFLKANLGIDSEKTDKIRFGGDLTYKPYIETPVSPSLVQGQFYYGITGDLNHMGWQGLVGLTAKEFNTDLYVVFNQIILDLDKRTASPYTWDLSQLIVSLVYNITKTMYIRGEYILNLEKAPEGVKAESVNNDTFFIELVTILK